jgi:hypothetical protein
MPITRPTPRVRRWCGVFGIVSALATPLLANSAGVAVLRAAAWSPGDAVREGAIEFEVLMCAAKLQHAHRAAGIVGVGDRHGLFVTGAERALHLLALQGVPVAKLARGGDVAADPDQLFLNASGLSETEASELLTRCLERHGTPPVAINPERPTAAELAAIRSHLQPFREAFALAVAPRVASK